MQGLDPFTRQCLYSTPCGWCAKWDKKCDKKIDKDTKLEDMFYSMLFNKMPNSRVKQIKVTTHFWNYLNNKFPPITLDEEFLSSPSGVRAEFTGIPVIVDDSIEHPFYELIFKEN